MMESIVTITFSPCIDKSASVPEMVSDKKLKCHHPTLEPGGGGINVARAIRKLGGQSAAIYPAGGYTGMHFNKLLKEEGVPSIIIETEQETRENIIILDESSNKQYRFGMPGSPMNDKEWKKVLSSLEQLNPHYIVASGSLPPGVPDDIFARISRIATKKKARLVVDTAGPPLKIATEEGVFLLKPNLAELAYLVEKERLDEKEIESLARQLIMKTKTEAIVVSMGSSGAMLVTRDEKLQLNSPESPKKSTVGAGDSMVAGIVLSLSQGRSIYDATRYGVACGTAATMNPGTELCRKEDADNLFEQINNQLEPMQSAAPV